MSKEIVKVTEEEKEVTKLERIPDPPRWRGGWWQKPPGAHIAAIAERNRQIDKRDQAHRLMMAETEEKILNHEANAAMHKLRRNVFQVKNGDRESGSQEE